MGNNLCSSKKRILKSENSAVPQRLAKTLYFDRLSATKIRILKEKFSSVPNDGNLNIQQFSQLFSLELYQDYYKTSAFQLFSGNSRRVTWHSLCLTISRYILGDLEEQCEFLFKIINYKCKETVSLREIKQFLKAISYKFPSSSMPKERELNCIEFSN